MENPGTTVDCEPAQASGRKAWRLAAWISGTFALLLVIGMGAGHVRVKAANPLESPALKDLKEQLRQKPTDEHLKQQIRSLDLELRTGYFTHISRSSSGVYFLLASSAVFLFSVSRLKGAREQLPPLKPGQGQAADPEERDAQMAAARWSVAATGCLIGAGLVVLSLSFTTALTDPALVKRSALAPDAGQTAEAAPDAAGVEEMKRNWPRFLGFNAGAAAATNAPANWDSKTGTGIVWKVPSPAAGFNSPIVWGERVFFSGGPPDKLEVFCLDATTGAVVWRQQVANVPGSPTGNLEIPESTGYTAPTMATDGRRVYAIFANGDLAAFTLEGKPVWTKAFGALKNPYGHATSLVTWQDRVIVQLDQGDSEDNKSKIYALDGRTGQVVWQRPRKVGGSWTSPLVFEAGGKAQVVALAVPWAIGYAANDGTELWRADCLNGEVTPSPIYSGGRLLVVSPSEKLLALKPDGQGDVSKTHVAWFSEDNAPDVTSPASNGELVFTVTTSGLLTCFDIQDGTKLWEHELELDVHASPALAGQRLYILSQKGVVVVIEPAREFKELFRTDMGDSFHASPAFTQTGNVIARGMSNIWCIGSSSKPGHQP